MSGVYGLFDPRDGRCRYVGQSVDVARRVTDHSRLGGVSRVQQEGFEIRQAGHGGFRAEVLEIVGHWSELNDAEARWVAEMRARGEADLNRQPGGNQGRPKAFNTTRADWTELDQRLQDHVEGLTELAQQACRMLPSRDADRVFKAITLIQLVAGNARITAGECPEWRG